ncbi:MAG: glycosyltransferase, partial [Flavobacteriales bacterium]
MISVVIPCLNEVEFIDATLESLLRQEPPGVDWEVIVADGGSTDGTREKLEEWSE